MVSNGSITEIRDKPPKQCFKGDKSHFFFFFYNKTFFVKFFLKRGNSLAVQWLGLSTFTAMAQVQSLVGEVRSQKLCGIAKKKKKAERERKQPNLQSHYNVIILLSVEYTHTFIPYIITLWISRFYFLKDNL